MQVRAATPQERALLAQVVGIHLTPEARGIVAMEGDVVRGGVLYDGWTENAVQVHMAASTPRVWESLLPAAFEYPFLEAGRGVLIGHVRASNRASVKRTRLLGFTEVARIKDGAAEGDDILVFTLRREDCRHIQRKAA